MNTRKPFLTARWEHLILLNFDCPAGLLNPLVPEGTELDGWEGSSIVSLVGFNFVDTRVLGHAIPGHGTFEEVNLRFYVRRRMPGGMVRRGVVFIKELVPRRAIAAVARLLYNEPYRAVAMSHRHGLSLTDGGSVEYSWIHRGIAHRLSASVGGAAVDHEPGSEGEFITEHYWGYTRQRDGGTLEYQVDHPRWRIWKTKEGHYSNPPGSDLYPSEFADILAQAPRSAFVAMGSNVAVYAGRRLERTDDARTGRALE